MSKLEIVREEDSKYNKEVELEQEVFPKDRPQRKEGRVKRILTHLLGPDGFKAVALNTLEQQIKPALKNLGGNIINMIFDGARRTVYDLIFGIGEGERMMRNQGVYGSSGFGFSGTPFRFNGGTASNQFHAAGNRKNYFDPNQTDAERNANRNKTYTQPSNVAEIEYFDSYDQATDFMNRLASHASTMGYLSVASYNQLCGRDYTPNNRNFGWHLEHLQDFATIDSCKYGYFVKLPQTVVLTA